jgi:hypothetical protein
VGDRERAANLVRCYSERVKHAILTLIVLLYIVWLGQNWGVYSGALMLAAIRSDARTPMRYPARSPGLTLYQPDT